MNELNINSLRRQYKSSYGDLFSKIDKLLTKQIKCEFAVPVNPDLQNRFNWLNNHICKSMMNLSNNR